MNNSNKKGENVKNEEVEAEIVETAPVLKDIKYPVSMVDINALLEEYAEVPEIDPESKEAAEQYQFVLKGHKRLVKARTSIEKTRKELKAPALEYGKKVDDIAKEFQAKIAATETALQIARKTVEDHEQRKLEEAEAAERQRVADIEAKITAIRDLPLTFFNSSDQIKAAIESVSVPSVDNFEEFHDKAIATYTATMQHLEAAYDTKVKAEQADRLEAERQEREAKERAVREAKERADREAFEAEQRAFREKQEAAERAARAQQEEINRQRAELEAEQLAAKQKAEREEREKQEAAERAAHEAEEKKAKAAREKADKKLFEQRKNESVEDITEEFTFGKADALIDAIIAGKVRHIKWVPDGK